MASTAACSSAEADLLSNPHGRRYGCSYGGGSKLFGCMKTADIAHGGALHNAPTTASVAVQIRKAGSMQMTELHRLFEHAARRETLFARGEKRRGGASAWTFFREPLSRWYSGYAELEGRLVYPHRVCPSTGNDAVWTRPATPEPTHSMLPSGAIGNLSALPKRNIWIGQVHSPRARAITIVHVHVACALAAALHAPYMLPEEE